MYKNKFKILIQTTKLNFSFQGLEHNKKLTQSYHCFDIIPRAFLSGSSPVHIIYVLKPWTHNDVYKLSTLNIYAFQHAVSAWKINTWLGSLILKTVLYYKQGHCGRDRMVVGFTTTYAINAYHH